MSRLTRPVATRGPARLPPRLESAVGGSTIPSSNLIRLGGVAGVCVGVFIFSFATIDTIIGGLFSVEALVGQPVGPWIDRVLANPLLAQIGMPLPIVGFCAMLIVGIVLFKIIPGKGWMKHLGLAGHLAGIPVAVSNFASGWAMVRHVLQIDLSSQDAMAQATPSFALRLGEFMMVNAFVGPFLILVVGNTSFAAAALRAGALPRGLCWWAIVNGVLMALAFFSLWVPILGVLGLAAPSTMLWFTVVGVHLLRRP